MNMRTGVLSEPETASQPAHWVTFPRIYEISTWVWLFELSKSSGRPVDLSSVPAAEWDAIAALGFDAVWLMGVWQRSPAGIAIANQNQNLVADFRRALPDYVQEDNVGSPYCIKDYVVDEHLGGPAGLAVARRELANRGLKLILDFVPNHVAPDHPWLKTNPEFFISGNTEELRKDPVSFTEVDGKVFACGRDPYFPAWQDVLQLNAFAPTLRAAVIRVLSDIAKQCDGVRCDMAMLLLNDVFSRTWSGRVGQTPATEYWVDVIPAVKKKNPNFLFIAEAYWDLEWKLQQLGFDFCYDKRLYDRLEHNAAEDTRLHLCADTSYQDKLIRFIENHDEPRAAATFPPAKHRAVALTISTVQGAKLFYEGQLDGRKVRLPVFLRRRPQETPDTNLRNFYATLLEVTSRRAFHEGEWSLCTRTGWPDNASFQNLVAWSWHYGSERYLIVVNLSGASTQGRVQVPWSDLGERPWHLTDLLSGAGYDRAGDEMHRPGLYVDLAPWSYHFFQMESTT